MPRRRYKRLKDTYIDPAAYAGRILVGWLVCLCGSFLRCFTPYVLATFLPPPRQRV